MNEAKPIVTCHGNQVLFSSLHSKVAQGLPKESCEWRRSYGRAPRSVNLEASFVPFDSDICLPDEEEKTLVSRPYFHIYWTDCDLDTYKQSVKDELVEWQAALKSRGIPDWLIVVVVSDESRVKAKLLPRASVIDKVKSDFCGKHPDRCIVLTEPTKLDSRSSESWSQLFQRLRSLLLQAFNRHLLKYEDSMRGRREKRNETGWNYFKYFLVQEELAFMFEMLGLQEDALIQYDELDAMFDQFVENFASGDTVKWLSPMMGPCPEWGGVTLEKPLDLDLRDEIKKNSATLLQFRNYLFLRQAALLFQMGRAWEVANRALRYLYNTVNEMERLQVKVPDGALSCWVFLSCISVLNACHQHNTSQLDDKFALCTANLWDFAHKKLRELGVLCSLMPDMEPTSEQLSLVVDLVAGMGESHLSKDLNPVDKLKSSLSSPEGFRMHYLEMCEQAMGTYKYIGRYRSARMIGLELADFYMKTGEASKAEIFLLESICTHQQEGWHQLADYTTLRLAQCQKALPDTQRYLKTCCHIACSQHINIEERLGHFEETLKALDSIDETVDMRASHVVHLDSVELSPVMANLNQELSLTIELVSCFPQPVTLSQVKVCIRPCQDDYTSPTNMSTQLQPNTPGRHRRQPSASHTGLTTVANFKPTSQQLPSTMSYHQYVEKDRGRPLVVGFSCDKAKELLKRTDSASSAGTNTKPLEKDDYSTCFSLTEVSLQPGSNTLRFDTKMTEPGNYQLSQLCLSIKSLDLLKPLSDFGSVFSVNSTPPTLTLTPTKTDQFIAGITQAAVLHFTCGSQPLDEGSNLLLTSDPPIKVVSADGDLRVKSLAAFESVELPVTVCMDVESEELSTHQCLIKLKVEQLEATLTQDVTFVQPFTTSHKMFTSGQKKYLQISLVGSSAAIFSISQPNLVSPNCADVNFSLMNKPDQILRVSQHQNASLLWLLEPNILELSTLDLTFKCLYTSVVDLGQEPRCAQYNCSLTDFQTSYILTYSVSSIEEDKDCLMGETAILDITVSSPLGHADSTPLAFSVQANGSVWAIGGKTTGVFSLREGKQHIALDVVPMRPGLLFYPLVTLYKYVDHLQAVEEDDTDSDSSPRDSSPRQNKKPRSESTTSATYFSQCLVDFSPGQVFNESRSRQILVSPCRENENKAGAVK